MITVGLSSSELQFIVQPTVVRVTLLSQDTTQLAYPTSIPSISVFILISFLSITAFEVDRSREYYHKMHLFTMNDKVELQFTHCTCVSDEPSKMFAVITSN